MKKLFILACLTVCSVALYAQKLKEGTAHYKIDYTMESDEGGMKGMLPTDANMFFKGDMFSADEAFQFVNSQYSDKPIRYEAKLWIIKTLVRQGKASDAEALFKTFQREEKFPDYLQDDLNCVAGDIYSKMGLYRFLSSTYHYDRVGPS